MEYIATFSKALTLERDKFNLDEDELTNSIQALNFTFSVEFGNPYERCAYMYKYATCHIHFLRDCMYNFFYGYEESKILIKGSKLNLCSLSFGPGLDYLAFSSTLLEVFEEGSVPIFQNMHILSKHGAWRNTINLLSDAVSEEINANINFDRLKVLEVDIFCNMKEKAVQVLKSTDVVLMFKPLNLNTSDKREEPSQIALNKLVLNLKPGSILFFIDNMPSCLMMREVLRAFSGEYLHGPVRVDSILPVEFPEFFKINGMKPVKSARGAIFVWKKEIPVFKQKTAILDCKLGVPYFSEVPSLVSISSKKELDSSENASSLKTVTTSENKGSTLINKGLESKLLNVSPSSKECSSEKQETLLNSSIEKKVKSTVEHFPISKPVKESKCILTEPVTDTSSNNQLSIIESLIDKINNLARSVEQL